MIGCATKRPIAVWALQYTEQNIESILKILKQNTTQKITFDMLTTSITIHKPRGDISLKINNWLIWEINTDNEFWVVERNIFNHTYDHIIANIYNKKSITIEYFKLEDTTTKTIVELFQFMHHNELINQDTNSKSIENIKNNNYALISTLEGVEKLHVGEYLIRGINNEYYPITQQSFNQVYD